MKITKPNITNGKWRIDKYNSLVDKNSKLISISTGLSTPISSPDAESRANAKAISAVPDMIDELISDYEAFEWMYEKTNETAIADYCHDKMESIKQTLIKLGCTYE